jgi:hypothetical protein
VNFVALDDQLTNIAQIVRKAPKITLRRAYSRALREWCQQTQWLRITVPGSTTANVETYGLGTDPGLDIIAIRAVSLTQVVGTTPQTFGLWPTDSSQWNLNLTPATPRRYCYVPEGSFALNPTPDAVYTLSLSVIVTPKETASAAQIPGDPLIKYSNDIEAGALAYLLALPGQPWTDAGAAARYGRDFASGIANGKAEVQRSYNTGSQRARPRPFLIGGFWR